MSSPGDRVDQWLSAMYRAQMLGVGNKADIFRRAHNTVAADPDMLAVVIERIPGLERVTRVRPNAYVEKKQLEYLQDLIKEPA